MKTKLSKTYLRWVEKLDSKKAGIAVSVLFAISLLPIVYVGLHNYATGDDYWFGGLTHAAWMETGSIAEALKASCRLVVQMYEEWQGTWFTLFLFTLSPNNFIENGYVLTVFIALGLLIASFAYVADYYLVKKLQFTKGAAAIIVCGVLYLYLQYMARTTSGIFWFNGIMHYYVPFFLGILALVHTDRFIQEKRIIDYIILFLSFTLLGGGSYLVPLAVTLLIGVMLVCQLKIKKGSIREQKIIIKYDWRNLWILAALLAELIGLAISFLAPGNSVRGGEEFGFSAKWALECVYYAIDRGIYLGMDYFTENPVILVVFVLLALLVWSQMWRVDTGKYQFRFPFLFILYTNGVYWASYTPEIYARSDVSGGVPNTYMQIFFLVTMANIVYVHGWLQRKLRERWHKKAEKRKVSFEIIEGQSPIGPVKYKPVILLPAVITGCVALVLCMCFTDIKTTNAYCIEYATGGKMQRYEEVRREQHRILMDPTITDAVIPEMTGDYPILHMALSENENASGNIDVAIYYNKNSVKAYMVE